jgi:hypothetical protein
MCDSERRDACSQDDIRRSNAVWWRQGTLRAAMWLLLAVAPLGMLHAGEPKTQPKALLDQIWPSPVAFQSRKQPLSEQDQAYAEAALIQWLESYLDPAYKVIDQRFFWLDRKYSSWVPVSKGHASSIGAEDSPWHGVEIEQSWRVPGSGFVRLWKVGIDGKDHYFAVAMTQQPVPGTHGRRLFARFELQKID